MTLRRMNFSLVLAGLVAMTACGGPNSFGIAKKSAQELTVVSDADLCHAQRFWRSPQMMQEIARRNLDCSANVAGGKNQPIPLAARQAQAAKSDKRVFTDPHEYCRAVGRSDDPLEDPRYKGPKATEQIATVLGVTLKDTKVVSGDGNVSYMVTWRCANGAMLACLDGAHPLCGQADTSRTPTKEMTEWCRVNPNQGIPGAVTGHFTIFDWKCAGNRPVAGRQLVSLDKEGYDIELWKRVPTADNESQRKPATTAAAASSRPTPSEKTEAQSKPVTCGNTTFKNLTVDQGKALKFVLTGSDGLYKEAGCITELVATDKFPLRGHTVVKYKATMLFPNGYRTECLQKKTFETGGFNGLFHQLNCSDLAIQPTRAGETRTFSGEEVI